VSSKSKAVGVFAAALLVGGGVAVLATAQANAPRMGAKGDRLDLRPLGPTCSKRGWPYYEDQCLRDRRQPAGQPDGVRRIGKDWAVPMNA
jgi:hypothetical protein